MAAIFQTFSVAFFLGENIWISIKISLKFVPKCPINNIPELVHKMAWRRSNGGYFTDAYFKILTGYMCSVTVL